MVVSHLSVSITVCLSSPKSRFCKDLSAVNSSGRDLGKAVGGGEMKQGREGGHVKCLLFSPLLLWLLGPYSPWDPWEPVQDTSELSHLRDMGAPTLCHKSGWALFWAVPCGIDFKHYWTSGVWTLAPEKAISKEVWSFSAGNGASPLRERPDGYGLGG